MDEQFRAALQDFLASPQLAETIIASTRAGFAQSFYSVELLPGGWQRLLWKVNIGNRFRTEGLILRVPALTDGEYDDLHLAVGNEHLPELANMLRGTPREQEIASALVRDLDAWLSAHHKQAS